MAKALSFDLRYREDKRLNVVPSGGGPVWRQRIEQDRLDILKRRQAWFDGHLGLDPERLVFIDATWASTIWPAFVAERPRVSD
jgi:hypothetical protein